MCPPSLDHMNSHTYTCTHTVMGGQSWKAPSLLTSALVPGVIFSIFSVLNIFAWARGTLAATVLPFSTSLALLCLWFGISVPLTLFGAYLGFRKKVRQLHACSTIDIITSCVTVARVQNGLCG